MACVRSFSLSPRILRLKPNILPAEEERGKEKDFFFIESLSLLCPVLCFETLPCIMLASLRRLLLVTLVGSTCQAFSPNSFSSARSTSPTVCFLTIEDGSDLVAASQQVYRPVQVHDEDGEDLLNPEDLPMSSVAVELEPSLITAPRHAALAFVKRLFAQPTAAFHPHQAEGLDGYPGEEQEGGDDVVYFPVCILPKNSVQ